MFKHTFTHIHPYIYKKTYMYIFMHVCTYTLLYIYISQHVDHPNINTLCLGGGTRCTGRVSVPCFTSDTSHKL